MDTALNESQTLNAQHSTLNAEPPALAFIVRSMLNVECFRHHHVILHSIKWRLQVWHGFLLVSLVAGLMAGFYTYERRARFQAIDSELAEATTPLMPRFAPPGELERGLRGPPGRGYAFSVATSSVTAPSPCQRRDPRVA